MKFPYYFAYPLLLAVMCACNSDKKKNTKNLETLTSTETSQQNKESGDQESIVTDRSFDFTNIPESKEETGVFPYVSDLPDYANNTSISNETKSVDFDKVLFFDGKKFIPMEGKLNYRRRLINDGKDFSAYKVQKSYGDMFTKMGAMKIFEGNARDYYNENYQKIPKANEKYTTNVGTEGTSLYALKKGNTHILFYLSVDGNYNGYYDLYVMQSGELKQTLSLITASKMKEELDKKGSVTLYINFETNKTAIKSDSEPTINEIYKLLNDNSGLKVSINGYTDNTGSPDRNQTLSEGRAKSVVAVLEKKGIVISRMQAKGFGQNDPIADNRTDEGKAKNRRVEIVKIK